MDVKSKKSLCKTRENRVTKQQIREMLERKKNGMMNFSASSLQKNIGNVDAQEIFESDESIDLEDTLAMGAVKSTTYERHVDDLHRTGCVNMDSFLGENAREQQKIWEKIQKERREEEENLKGMRHQEVVKEQEQILRQIQEKN